MAKKKTSLYKVEMSTGTYSLVILYFYGRNADSVKRFCKEKHYPKLKYDHINVIKIGEYRYTIEEPVVQFTEYEREQIEKHFMNEKHKLRDKFGAKHYLNNETYDIIASDPNEIPV